LKILSFRTTTPTSFPPDAVIRQVALAAGKDPKLKAALKSVAAGQPSKKHLQIFQTRAEELKATCDPSGFNDETKDILDDFTENDMDAYNLTEELVLRK
jgi:hypothetical protein